MAMEETDEELEGLGEKSRDKINFPKILMLHLFNIGKETQHARNTRGTQLNDMVEHLEAVLDYARDKEYNQEIKDMEKEIAETPEAKRFTTEFRIKCARNKTRALARLMHRKGYLIESTGGDDYGE